MRISLMFLVVGLLLLTLAPSVQAQAPTLQVQEARSLYDLGVLAYHQERWPACADYFERSFTLAFAPELLFNIGRCYNRAGTAANDVELLNRSVTAFVRYIRELPAATDRAAVETEIAGLRTRIAALAPALVTPIPVTPFAASFDPEPIVVASRPIVPVPATPVAERGFHYPLTVVGASVTLATLIAALVVGVVGDGQSDPTEANSLLKVANVLFGVSGVLLVGSGVVFGIEYVGGF